jgi:hypothetical protein
MVTEVKHIMTGVNGEVDTKRRQNDRYQHDVDITSHGNKKYIRHHDQSYMTM